MRYSKGHKEETRRKLLDSSRALVKGRGFDATGVDALMAAIGLTSGAFYSHFPSKQALFEEVVREEIDHTLHMLSAPGVGGPEDLVKALDMYLSQSHVLHPESGCVLPALGAEIGRTSLAVRAIVEGGLMSLHESWTRVIGDSDAAWSVMCQCVGALLVARTVRSAQTRNTILEANRRHILRSVVGLTRRH